MKLIFAICAVVALPLVAQADPPAKPRVVDVDFWGTVLSVVEGDGQSVGDPVHGRLTIDLCRAPDDGAPGPNLGFYNWNPQCDPEGCPPGGRVPSFVDTKGQKFRGESHDAVRFFDDSGPIDTHGVFISDVETATQPVNGFVDRFFLTLDVQGRLDFVAGDGLPQRVDVRPDNAPGGLFGQGHWQEFFAGVKSYFTFNIDRLRMTPRVCKM
jgi:hypothetical protein